MAPPDDRVRACGALPIEVFAAAQLALRRRKIRKRAKTFTALGARRRHKLRIQAKELRDAVDVFSSLFSGKRADKRRQKFLAALDAVRDCLGAIDDMAAHEKMIGASGRRHRAAGGKKAFTVGQLAGGEGALLINTEEALERFAKAKPFWR